MDHGFGGILFPADSAEAIEFLLSFALGALGGGGHALKPGEFLIGIAEGFAQWRIDVRAFGHFVFPQLGFDQVIAAELPSEADDAIKQVALFDALGFVAFVIFGVEGVEISCLSPRMMRAFA